MSFRVRRLGIEFLENREVPATWNYFGSEPGLSSDPNNWLEGSFHDGDDVYVPVATGPMTLQANAIGSFIVETGYNKTIFAGSLSIQGGNLDSVMLNVSGDFHNLGDLFAGNIGFLNGGNQQTPPKVFNDKKMVITQGKAVDANIPVVNASNGTIVLIGSSLRLGGAGYTTFINEGTIQAGFHASIIAANETLNSGTIEIWASDSLYFDGHLSNIGGTINLGGIAPGGAPGFARLSVAGIHTVPGNNSIYSSGGTFNIKGGSDILTTHGWYSESDHINFLPADTAQSTSTYSVGITGQMNVYNSTIILGGAASGGQFVLSSYDAVYLTNTTVQSILDWGLNSMDKWRASSFQINGGIFAIGILNEPAVIPAGRQWLAFEAPGGITGNFGSFLLGPDYTAKKIDADKNLVIETVGMPPPPEEEE